MRNTKTSHHHDRQQIGGTIISIRIESTTNIESIWFCPTIHFYQSTQSRQNEQCRWLFIMLNKVRLNWKKINFKTREDVPTQSTDVDIESTGIEEEDQVLFQTDEAELPSEEQLWQQKREERNTVHKEPPVINASHCHINDKYTNTLTRNMEQSNKIPRILIEQGWDPVLIILKRQMLGSPFD